MAEPLVNKADYVEIHMFIEQQLNTNINHLYARSYNTNINHLYARSYKNKWFQ